MDLRIDGVPVTHNARFSIAVHTRDYTVPKCPAHPTIKYDLQKDITFCHPGNGVDILGKGVYPQCKQCGMQVASLVIGSHGYETKGTCRLWAERMAQWEASSN